MMQMHLPDAVREYFTYRGNNTSEISFPLGGLGTGCIGLAGNGRLLNWEIFNKPNKGSTNGFSHFAIKVEAGDRVLDARVLNSDLPPPYSGQLGAPAYQSFGWGPPRQTLAGLPHFRTGEFLGTFPLATLALRDDTFPGTVTLLAYNPFIPLNDVDSGIPAAFFAITIKNTTEQSLTYTVAGTLANPLPAANLHTLLAEEGRHLLHLTSDAAAPAAVTYADFCLATDAPRAQGQAYWYRGSWMDNLEIYWRDFTALAPLPARNYPAEQCGEGDHGTLAVPCTLAPGEATTIRFVITWNVPNCENYWNPPAAAACTGGCSCGTPPATTPNATWKNYYATLWPDARASATYCLRHWERLYRETLAFTETLFASTLPPVALDAVSANLSILKSPTVLRLEDGTFYGWEGCHPTAGCCEGSCTHVWNYAQALPFLFPKLERSMREADYRYNLREDGGMPFRLQLPLGRERSGFRPCADGQFGGVMKAYRDWKICGDTAWLRRLWPALTAAIAFAWHPANEDRWDPEQTGVLWGRQHHTLDMELFGPNAWLTGFYLGALKAGAEMADALGETATASLYRPLFAKGKAWVDQHLFNGDYYYQQIDLGDARLLAPFASGTTAMLGKSIMATYWSDEHAKLKYQIGEGCALDQLLAQWHANLYGLGELFEPAADGARAGGDLPQQFQAPAARLLQPLAPFSA